MKKSILFFALSLIAMMNGFAQITGTWKLSPVETSLAVGPAKGDYSWWKVPAAEITGVRACQYDDEFVFNSDGTFKNNLGTQTFLESWQGGSSACGTPVAPHDGTAKATWKYNASTSKITIYGKGAFLGLPKVYNGGELSSPTNAKDSITYEVSVTGNNMSLDIAISGGYWHFELVKQAQPIDPTGYWKLRPVGTSLAVGPAKNDFSWWKVPDAEITGVRNCQYDDYFIFKADGSFKNELQNSTFLESWQGGSSSCGTPVAPFDGTANAKWSVDNAKGVITLVGKGAFLGLPKAYNGGELSSPSGAKDTLKYEAAIINDTMWLNIGIAGGAYWHFELLKTQAPVSKVSSISTTEMSIYPNPSNGVYHIAKAQDVLISSVKVYNLFGQQINSIEFNQNNLEFNLNYASAGTYLVSIETNAGTLHRQIIKN